MNYSYSISLPMISHWSHYYNHIIITLTLTHPGFSDIHIFIIITFDDKVTSITKQFISDTMWTRVSNYTTKKK